MTEADLRGLYDFIKEIIVMGCGVGFFLWRMYCFFKAEDDKIRDKFEIETKKIVEANLSTFKICSAELETVIKEQNAKTDKLRVECIEDRNRIYERVDLIKLQNTKDFISKDIFENERKHHNDMVDQKLANMIQLFTAQISNINTTLVKMETTVNRLVEQGQK